MSLRICFAGTPPFAADILRTLIDNPTYEMVGVYTQPDKPCGRGQKIQASAVKLLAEQHKLPVLQPKSLRNDAALAEFQTLKPDVFVVVAYGLLIPSGFLTYPPHGCINVHASLLPRFRGAAPIQRAIEAGDAETGITIMQMDEGLDTGDMLLKRYCNIDAKDTTTTLSQKLLDLGKSALTVVLDRLATGEALFPEKQEEALANYAHKIQKSEAFLDFSLPAETLDRKIRAFNPWPVACCHLHPGGPIVRIFEATPINYPHQASPGTVLEVSKKGLFIATGKGGCLQVTTLQLPGKKPQDIGTLWQHPDLQVAVA